MSFTRISEIGEFGLIGKIHDQMKATEALTPRLTKGIGDDCAVVAITDERSMVISTDLLIEQIHFDLLTIPMEHLGAKALGVNISDICAMNAKPLYATISLGLSERQSVEMIEAFYTGLKNAAMQYGVSIIGGDTSASVSGMVISITVVGEAAPKKLSYRSGAKVGDRIFVSGDLGRSYAGLKVLMRERKLMMEAYEAGDASDAESLRELLPDLKEYQSAIQKHLLPKARIDVVKLFEEQGIIPTAMIDVSDGLGSELKHLTRESGVGALIEETKIPILSETREISDEFEDDASVYALFGGEDYELLFTVNETDAKKLEGIKEFAEIGSIYPKDFGTKMTDIFGESVDLMRSSGFQHFKNPEDSEADDALPENE
ncbi:MAG: thiamine-phosphate kinase [Chloroherpetonaceae bacterium]|nr:thiamine-phosphate kinase [Chloroherpetonaceae bacterium]